MHNETYFIDIDVIGDITGERYVGKFEVKLFPTMQDRALIRREINRATSGLSQTPSWDFEGFVKGLRDKIDNITEDAKLNLTEQQIGRIILLAGLAIPIADPEVDLMATIAELNILMVGVPEWWGRVQGDLGGYSLKDWSPIVAIRNELATLRASVVKPPK
jgi:hypothetical protein